MRTLPHRHKFEAPIHKSLKYQLFISALFHRYAFFKKAFMLSEVSRKDDIPQLTGLVATMKLQNC